MFLDVFRSLKAANWAEIGLFIDFGASLQNDRFSPRSSPVLWSRDPHAWYWVPCCVHLL